MSDPAHADEAVIRIAAAGDLHAGSDSGAIIAERFSRVDAAVTDLVLLAGDLTTHGEPSEAAVLASACRGMTRPVIAVLGNHDHHADRCQELVAVLEDAGVQVLERAHTVISVKGVQVGVVGLKGFIGGFPGSHLPDFGERLLRRCYADTSADVAALDAGLRAITHCPVRVVLLHYSPSEDTLRGEPREIWTMLGSDRLAAPIREHEPDLVLHGHAHAGTFHGEIEATPVYNVSAPVIQRDFWTFEIAIPDAARGMH